MFLCLLNAVSVSGSSLSVIQRHQEVFFFHVETFSLDELSCLAISENEGGENVETGNGDVVIQDEEITLLLSLSCTQENCLVRVLIMTLTYVPSRTDIWNKALINREQPKMTLSLSKLTVILNLGLNEQILCCLK